MKSVAYWSKRMEQLNESLLDKGVPFTKAMNKEYRKAQISIQTDVNNFYQRFADNNGIVSLSAAKQVLKAGELKEFKWSVEDYIARGKENAIDQRWMKELENASIKVRVTRLESIQLQMKQHVEELSAKRLAGTTELLGNVYKDGYYRSIFELEKGIGIGASFAKIDKRQLEAILSAPWAPDGSSFSQRIWTDRVKLTGTLRNIFTQGLIRGDTSKQMVEQLMDRFDVSRKNAERLILTESAYFAGQSRIAGYKELGVEQYRYTATLDSRTSITCRDLDGKVFDVEDAQVNVNYPPMHAYCRSTTIPHYDDNIKERVARDEEGKTYEVPEDITYPEWEKKYAPEATEPVTVETPSKKIPETPLPTIEIPGGPTKDIPIPQRKIENVSPEELPVQIDLDSVILEPKKYHKFTSEKEADDWVESVTPDWIKKLTIEESEAIRRYSGDEYVDINRNLREGLSDPIYDKLIDNISSGLAKFKLPEPITVYRGMQRDVFSQPAEELIGKIVEEKAFASTTLLADRAFSGTVRLEIRIPENTLGAAIIQLSEYPGEYEFLLDKGMRYQIKEASDVGGMLILIGEVQNDQ